MLPFTYHLENNNIAKALFILSGPIMLGALGMDIYIPAIPSMSAYLKTTPGMIQWTLSIYMIGTAVGQLFLGPLTDSIGRKSSMLLYIVIFIIATICCALAKDIESLIISRLAQSIGACGTMVVSQAIVRDVFIGNNRTKVYSYLNGLIGTAPLLAPFLGAHLLAWYGSFRASFVFLAIFSLIFLVINIPMKDTLAKSARLPLNIVIIKRYFEIIKNKEFLLYSYASSVGLLALFFFFSVSAPLVIEVLGVTPQKFGYYFGANGMVLFLVSFFVPTISARIGTKTLVTIGLIIMMLGSTIMLLWHLKYGATLMGLTIPMMITTTGVVMIFGPSANGAITPFGHMAGTASAMMGFIRFGFPGFMGKLCLYDSITNVLPLCLPILGCSTIGVILFLTLFKNMEKDKL